ncbi:hypothetical protein GCM10027425_15650 [Alteromonas gracilis]
MSGQDDRLRVATVVTRCIAGAGGVAVRGLLQLDPHDYRRTLITGQGGPLTEQAERAGVEVLITPGLVPEPDPRRDAAELARLTRHLAERGYDVVHTHSAKAGAIGRTAAHRAGVRRIVHTYHGFPFHPFQSAPRRAAYLTVERRLARWTDVVLAIGTGVATEALRRGLARPGALRTVTPVVDSRTVAVTPQSRARARELLGLPRDVRVVGTVGRLDEQKAPEDFVAALRRLPDDVHGVWVGSGPHEQRVRAAIAGAGLGSRLHLVGERRDVPDLLPGFDVFAMSSLYEGLPCAIVEAMRCGLPVVATMVNSVPDLVVPGESGLLVAPRRPGELAEAIVRLLDDPIAAARMAARGHALADAGYVEDAAAAVLDEVYRGARRTEAVMRRAV